MTQGVYLIDDFRRFGDSGNADFSPGCSRGSDGDISNSDDTLPEPLEEIYSAHIFYPDLVLRFGYQSAADDDPVSRQFITGAGYFNYDPQQYDYSKNRRSQNDSQQNKPEIVHRAWTVNVYRLLLGYIFQKHF